VLRHTEPRKLMALLRGELDCVVMKCLEKSRERRYETANALSRDIQRYLADEPVEARPPSAGYRLSKFLRRNRGAVIAAALVLLALLAGITGTTFGVIRAEKRRIEAMKQRDIADKASVEALAQKKIADDQKQLAIANASKANENARKAELRLAEGLISQADVLSLAGLFADAHALYTEAYDRFAELKAPMIAAEVGLWNSYRQVIFPLLSFAGHSKLVWSVAISPDGRTALSGSHDKTLKLWELATGKELRTFTGHTGPVNSVAIARDGRTALSGSSDNTLKLWDLASGKQLRTLTGHSEGVSRVAIAPDGRTAISGSGDNTLKLWDTEPERMRRHKAIAAAYELNRRAERAISLVRAGRFPEAVAEVAELTKNPTWTAGQWYNFACVYSLASTEIADKKNEYADRAMELLQKAVKAGWKNAIDTANDTDLAPLGEREDFKKLLAELEKKATAKSAKSQ
jgi:eukaryotic-like serine/threonine-protein kinase